jgi:uncharacterized phage protein gp47/JayE
MPVVNTKTKEEIISRIINALEQNAGLSATSPGSIARAFADAFGTEMFYLHESFKEAVSQTSISTAYGRSLDLIGELYNVTRKSISQPLAYERSTANIEFILNNPHSSDLVIPKGTTIYNDVGSYSSTQYYYNLSENVTILAGVTKAYGRVEPNFQSNEYVASVGSLTRHNFISPPGVIVFCSNPKEVYSVLNAESDDNYRRRIISAVKINSTSSTESVRFTALSINGVRDIRIREASFGLGSCQVVIIPEVAGNVGNIPTLVAAAIEQVRPIGVRMSVAVADPVEYSVNATIILPFGTSSNLRAGIENQAAIFVKRYLNSLTIGDTASMQEVERQIRISSDLVRSINITSATAGGINVNKKDFRPPGEKQYIVSGEINISSVIIGLSNY